MSNMNSERSQKHLAMCVFVGSVNIGPSTQLKCSTESSVVICVCDCVIWVIGFMVFRRQIQMFCALALITGSFFLSTSLSHSLFPSFNQSLYLSPTFSLFIALSFLSLFSPSLSLSLSLPLSPSLSLSVSL